MANKTKKVLKKVKKDDVDFVNLEFTDINSRVKSVTIPTRRLEDSLKRGTWFDGSSIEGFTRISESDMFLKPDPDTYAVLPWYSEDGSSVARLICDVYKPDNEPFEGDPRYCLKKVMEEAREMGFEYNTGPELEFFLLKKENSKIKPLPHDSGGYFDLTLDNAYNIRKKMINALESLGLKVETSHHEVAGGQHEIDFEYDDALTTADRAVTLKFTLKAIAQSENLHATFMPKPLLEENGSGMHVHQSLFDVETGENLFFSEDNRYHLSDTARHFLAGQMKYIKELTAVINPTVNSYKRLVPGYEAPVHICWGQRNRSALIRIPRYSEGRESSTRLEIRSPDPSNNPYLAFAVMLSAGLKGIKEKMTPPDPVEEDVYEFGDPKLKELSIGTLPLTLGDALRKFEQSDLARETLGEHLFEEIYRGRKQQWREYCRHVTNWELDRYLEH